MRLVLAFLLGSACLPTSSLPISGRPELRRELEGQQRYLRATTALFPQSPNVPLLRAVKAPAGIQLAPAGTPARIVRLEVPTLWGVARSRGAIRPGARVEVELEGFGPAELALPDGLRTTGELLDVVDEALALADPRPRLARFPENIQRAIATQTAVLDMPDEALELAWGSPEHRRLELLPEGRREVWLWAGGARQAVLVDGRVAESTDGGGH